MMRLLDPVCNGEGEAVNDLWRCALQGHLAVGVRAFLLGGGPARRAGSGSSALLCLEASRPIVRCMYCREVVNARGADLPRRGLSLRACRVFASGLRSARAQSRLQVHHNLLGAYPHLASCHCHNTPNCTH